MAKKLGFLVIFFITMLFCSIVFLRSDSSRVWAYVLLFFCVIISALGASVLWQITELGIVVAGVAGGFFLSFLMNYIIFWRVSSTPTWLFLEFLILYFMIIGGILGYEFKDIIVIVATSLIGAYITIRSISVVFGGFVNEFEINTWLSTGTLPHIPWTMYVYVILIFILFGIGVFLQMKWRNFNMKTIIPNKEMAHRLEQVNNYGLKNQ